MISHSPDDQFTDATMNTPALPIFEGERLQILDILTGPHTKCRVEKPAEYPARNLPPEVVDFEDPRYAPTYFASPKLYDAEGKLEPWAIPLPNEVAEREQVLSEYKKNPGGPTGIYGPGELGSNENWAADTIVFTIQPETGKIYQLQILRDIGQWANPGGMVDKGEFSIDAAIRELAEETGMELESESSTNPVQVYEGYVDDYRNTDTHFMMSTVHMTVVDWSVASNTKFKVNDQEEGIGDLGLKPLNREHVDAMFASHPNFVKLALIELAQRIDSYALDATLRREVLGHISSIVSSS